MSTTSLPITFPPTPILESSARKAGDDIRSRVESTPPEKTTALKYFEFSDVTTNYEAFYQSEQSIHEFLPAAEEKRHFPPGVIVLQSGKTFPIEDGVSVTAAIVLLRIGELETEIEYEKGKMKKIDWGHIGSVVYLPGSSLIKSSGSGKVACLFKAYQK
ncbi:hypothetical protein FQN54_004710 [Arachnomyces sp. PD_36]|nr:hypothetical protein FQN54_004710 [Arachnomyces sp. PD_36]